MHAVVVRVQLSDNPDPTVLRERVVPQVKELPGFIAGYWTRAGGEGRSMVVFDSEANATAASERVPSMIPSGTNIIENDVCEVVANA